MSNDDLEQYDWGKLADLLQRGGIVAYPTESVYGLGCDPFNRKAVQRLRQIKQRPVEQGFILLASDWQQIKHLTQAISDTSWQQIQKTWPGAVTWVFPASKHVPPWLIGADKTIALRVTEHPIAHTICRFFQGPIVSSSANLYDQPPARSYEDSKRIFGDLIDEIVPGQVGNLAKPTDIRDAISSKYLRGPQTTLPPFPSG